MDDSVPFVGRGGLKLRAALEHFGLESRVRGALAIDVGASTGGFTDCLLQYGAARVACVDVGHGQLDERLRGDARVELHERVHFKSAPLELLPGPFDFFTVDVSFVAARTMLRSLAFRLRTGAEGIILVKPQFELPGGYVRGGRVDAEGLRAWALKRVSRRGADLGFELCGAIDSPVPGGEGSVEILSHWRFGERGPRMPQRPDVAGREAPTAAPVATKPATKLASAPKVRVAVPAAYQLFAVAAPGTEALVERELRALGLGGIKPVDGGVEFAGGQEAVYRANLWLRTATRVLSRVGSPGGFGARDFAELVSKARQLPWERFVPPEAALEFHVSAHASKLYHTGAIAERLLRAIGERLGSNVSAVAKSAADASGGGRTAIFARGVHDRWVLSVDTSGELLHRRGYRQETAKAPLRETLAAAVLMLSGWDPSRPLVDPMCGSGTLALEACAMALGRAPGLTRRFAFEHWPGFDEARWAQLCAEARGGERPAPPASIVAADRAAGAIEATRRNAVRAGLETHLDLRCVELAELTVTGPPGVVVVNPPYGRRVATGGPPRAAFANLARMLRARFRGWDAAVLVPDRQLSAALGPRVAEHPLWHGGSRVTLAVLRL